jgi:zinc transport system substrate-binding protein
VFWVGPQLEIFLQNALVALPDRVRVVSLQEKTDIEDAHIWMNPLRAETIVRRMAAVLTELAPAQRQQWQDNAERTVAALQREDESLRSQLAALQLPRRYLVVHDAYRQFETRYGLKHEAVLTNTSDQPPGARNMAHIQELLSNGTIQCVLREPLHQPKALQNLLRGNSVRVITVDALAGDIQTRQDGIVEFYRKFGQAMLACLKS